jgi:hypothetical protein
MYSWCLLGVQQTATAEHAQADVKALVFANVDWISQQPQWAQYVFHHRPSSKGPGQSKLNGKDDSRREVPLIDYRDSFAEAAWLSIKK